MKIVKNTHQRAMHMPLLIQFPPHLQRTDRTIGPFRATHDGSVQLHLALGIRKTTIPHIVLLLVISLYTIDSGFDGIQSEGEREGRRGGGKDLGCFLDSEPTEVPGSRRHSTFGSRRRRLAERFSHGNQEEQQQQQDA